MELLLDLLERCEKLDIRGWYRAKAELAALREAGKKMANRLRVTRNWAKTSGFENADLAFTMEDAAALEAWEAANK